MNLTIEDLRLLAQAEQDMHSGKVPWVRVEGTTGRAIMRPETMEALGLSTGQTISWGLFGEIAKLHLQQLEQQIAYERGQQLIREVLG